MDQSGIIDTVGSEFDVFFIWMREKNSGDGWRRHGVYTHLCPDDLHAYKSGAYDDHAHKGADLARDILGELKLTDDAETDMICSAIYYHDNKLTADSPMDEVLKDADVIHHCMNDLSKQIKEKEQARFDKLCDEFGM